jgi:hypothetical protein
MSKEKLSSCLNLTGTPHVAILYALFVELRLRVMVVSLPLLAVYEVAGADLGSIRTPLLASVPKENEWDIDVLYLDSYYVLTHKGAPAACKDNSTLC